MGTAKRQAHGAPLPPGSVKISLLMNSTPSPYFKYTASHRSAGKPSRGITYVTPPAASTHHWVFHGRRGEVIDKMRGG